MPSTHFFVMVDSENDFQVGRFVEFLSSRNIGYWHYIRNSWLIIDDTGTLNSYTLRDYLKQAYPGVHCIVFEAPLVTDFAGVVGSENSAAASKYLNTVLKTLSNPRPVMKHLPNA